MDVSTAMAGLQASKAGTVYTAACKQVRMGTHHVGGPHLFIWTSASLSWRLSWFRMDVSTAMAGLQASKAGTVYTAACKQVRMGTHHVGGPHLFIWTSTSLSWRMSWFRMDVSASVAGFPTQMHSSLRFSWQASDDDYTSCIGTSPVHLDLHVTQLAHELVQDGCQRQCGCDDQTHHARAAHRARCLMALHQHGA